MTTLTPIVTIPAMGSCGATVVFEALTYEEIAARAAGGALAVVAAARSVTSFVRPK